MSETAKHREQVQRYCQGNGVDLGSGTDPVVPWAIQVELPEGPYDGRPRLPEQRAEWLGTVEILPFQDETLDFVHASHVLEDFEDWLPLLREWDRALKRGGYLIIAVPDHVRFRRAVEVLGQGDNLAHKHESYVGELSERLGGRYIVHCDRFVSASPDEYSILFVGQKVAARLDGAI